ncbi:MAG: Sec-independent protein translocase subunit TatA [Gammaproteobacteria bacterium]
MGAFSIWHWLIVLLVVVLLFGSKKLRNLGGDLGTAFHGFKKGMKGEESKDDAATLASSSSADENNKDK